MSFYKEVLKIGTFSLDDAVNICGNPNTAASAVYSLKKRGLAKSVKRNLFTVISLETGVPVSSPYEIGCRITKSAYISHHSAFEYYGTANQVFKDIYVSSNERFRDFEFDGRIYHYVASKLSDGVDVRKKIKVTDIERTVIDSIKDFSKIGGLEELLRCFDLITVLNEAKLVDYLDKYNNRFLWQKAGYILSGYADSLKLSENFFEKCKSETGKSVRYLFKDLNQSDSFYSAEWQLVVPKNLNTITDEGGDIDV